jgi:GT2 family glycosyltransferase
MAVMADTTQHGSRRRANVSVVIATLNRPEAIGHCLAALRSGSRLPAEIIVVDQSDDEQTRKVVEQHCDRGTRVRYIHRERHGMSAAQNAGFAEATYPLIAVTDDDCQPDAEWIATLLRICTEAPELDALAGRVLPLPPEGNRTYPVASRTSVIRTDFSGKSLPWRVGSGNNFAVRREWLARVGGCDERLGPGTQGKGAADMDLFYRLLRSGARIRYEPDLLVYHERQSRSDRLARRPMYGHGMTAFCVINLRQGDLYSLYILWRWLWARCKRLAFALPRRDGRVIREQLLTLAGGLKGIVYGLHVKARKEP